MKELKESLESYLSENSDLIKALEDQIFKNKKLEERIKII